MTLKDAQKFNYINFHGYYYDNSQSFFQLQIFIYFSLRLKRKNKSEKCLHSKSFAIKVIKLFLKVSIKICYEI